MYQTNLFQNLKIRIKPQHFNKFDLNYIIFFLLLKTKVIKLFNSMDKTKQLLKKYNFKY